MQPMNPTVLGVPLFEKSVVSVGFDSSDESFRAFDTDGAPRSPVSDVVRDCSFKSFGRSGTLSGPGLGYSDLKPSMVL
jgi:hypothetical protein